METDRRFCPFARHAYAVVSCAKLTTWWSRRIHGLAVKPCWSTRLCLHTSNHRRSPRLKVARLPARWCGLQLSCYIIELIYSVQLVAGRTLCRPQPFLTTRNSEFSPVYDKVYCISEASSIITPVAMTREDIIKFKADWKAAVQRGIDAGLARTSGCLTVIHLPR